MLSLRQTRTKTTKVDEEATEELLTHIMFHHISSLQIHDLYGSLCNLSL
jgi:hypothetical protein